MPGRSRNLAQLPSAIFKTNSKRIDGNASSTEPSGRDDHIIVRNTIGHDNQYLLPSGVGMGQEQVPGSPSDCQTGPSSPVDVRDLLNSVHDFTPGEVSVKLEYWLRSASKHDHADMSSVSGNDEATRYFLDEVFNALEVTLTVHLDATRRVDKEANIDLSFAHCEEIRARG